MREINALVIHHAAGARMTSVKRIRKMHTDPKPAGRGWPDIGYHGIVNGNGTFVPGRPLNRVGFHCRPNKTSIGLLIAGWNDNDAHPEWAWTDQQIERANEVIRAYLLLFPSIVFVGGHRDTGYATLCPGLGPWGVYDVLDIPARYRRKAPWRQ